MKSEILKCFKQDMSYLDICKKLGCASSTVSYHAKKVGYKSSTNNNPPIARIYDWHEIQSYHDLGHSINECRKRFGFAKRTYEKAVSKGKFKVNIQPTLNLNEILVSDRPQTSRGYLKARLLKENLIQTVCAECRLEPSWNNKPLVMHLDHINGQPKDNRLENLRLICPNCHSQTATYAGRNVNKNKQR